MEKIIRIGVDTSKQLFQVHGVDGSEGVVLRQQLRRGEMERFFGALPLWFKATALSLRGEIHRLVYRCFTPTGNHSGSPAWCRVTRGRWYSAGV